MRRITSIVVALVVAAGVLVTTPTPAAAAGTISGVVRDSAGNPIAGATVYALTSPFVSPFTPNVTSASDGSYSLSVPAFPVAYRVGATASGLGFGFAGGSTWAAAATYQITFADVTGADVVVTRASAVLAGTITAPDGTPVAGARVTARVLDGPLGVPGITGDRTVTTGADGTYRIEGMLVARYNVEAQPPLIDTLLTTPYGWPAPTVPVTTAEDTTSTADIRLLAASTVSGRIVDPEGDPVGNAVAIVSGYPEPRTAFSAPDGTFTIVGVYPGESGFIFEPPSGGDPLLVTYYGSTADPALAQSLDVPEGVQLDVGDITMVRGGIVNSTVVGGGSALIVACASPARPALVDGQFGVQPGCTAGESRSIDLVGVLAPGDYNIAAAVFEVTGYVFSATASATVVGGGVIDCTFEAAGGPSTCIAGDPATNDGDNVPPREEDLAPNGGDGNGDGTRDAVQSHVASIRSPRDGAIVTVVSVPATPLTSVRASIGFVPAGLPEVGTLSGRIAVPTGASLDLQLIKATPWRATELASFSTPTGPPPIPAFIVEGTRATVTLTDGGVGDAQVIFSPSPPDGFIDFNLTPVIVDRVPPTITCPAGVVLGVDPFGLGSITATVTDDVDPPTTVSVSVPAFTAGVFMATVFAVDRSGNRSTVSCPYEVIDDGDGVPASHERRRGGDADANGVPDELQGNVATTPFGFGGADVSIVAPSGTQLFGVFAGFPFFGSPPPAPGTYEEVEINLSLGVAAGSTVDVDLVRHGITTIDATAVLSRNGLTSVNLPARNVGNRLTVALTDGGRGDNDGTADGVIRFRGVPVIADTAPPDITCVARAPFFVGDFGTLQAIVTDSQSGVDQALLEQVVDTSLVGTFLVRFVAADRVGNQAVADCQYEVVPVPDTTPPVIVCQEGSPFLLNQSAATVNAFAFDTGSGVDNPSITVAVPTNALGRRLVAVTATDRAGNTATTSCPYTVGVRIARLQQPNPNEISVVKAGRTTPVIWRVVDANGAPVADAAHFVGITTTPIACPRGKTESVDDDRRAGLRYLGNGRWSYGWTPPSQKGCYELRLEVVGDSLTARIRVN